MNIAKEIERDMKRRMKKKREIIQALLKQCTFKQLEQVEIFLDAQFKPGGIFGKKRNG